jgi:tetratricopeptide (TPR) repeat protein
MLSIRQIRDGLSDRFQLLTGGARTAVPRHQTLRASVDWSVDLLNEGERCLLARLSVFAGGFTLDAARGVTTGGPVGDRELLDLLTALVDRSLVHTDEGPRVVRYQLLETIREYAGEDLVVAGEVDAVRDRHAAFFLALAETAEPQLEGRGQIEWMAALEHERANMRAAVHWASARQDGETARRLVAALVWFLVISGHPREAKKLFDAALDTPATSTATLARALQARSYLAWHQDDRAEAAATAMHAAMLAREVDDRRTEARALYVTGILTAGEDLHDLTDLETSIAMARETADHWCLAHALVAAGLFYVRRGDTDEAEPLLRESVAVCEAMGDTFIINSARQWLGHSLLLAGEHAEAVALLEAVVQGARESVDTFSLPTALSLLGTELALRGSTQLGLAYLEEAATIARRGGQRRTWQLVTALQMKAQVLLTQRSSAARPVLDELTDIATGHSEAASFTAAFAALAIVDVLDGDLDTAEERLRDARERPADAASRSALNVAAASIARAKGDLDAASSFLEEALGRGPRDADAMAVSWAIMILEMLADVLAASGRARDGVRLLGAAQAARSHHAFSGPQPDDGDPESTLAAARQLLGVAETDRAWDEGLAMTIGDAVALVQTQRG